MSRLCKYWSVTQNTCVHIDTLKATLSEPTFENAKVVTLIQDVRRKKRTCPCGDRDINRHY